MLTVNRFKKLTDRFVNRLLNCYPREERGHRRANELGRMADARQESQPSVAVQGRLIYG